MLVKLGFYMELAEFDASDAQELERAKLVASDIQEHVQRRIRRYRHQPILATVNRGVMGPGERKVLQAHIGKPRHGKPILTKEVLLDALNRTGWHVSSAARLLKYSEAPVYRAMHKYGLEPKGTRKTAFQRRT